MRLTSTSEVFTSSTQYQVPSIILERTLDEQLLRLDAGFPKINVEVYLTAIIMTLSIVTDKKEIRQTGYSILEEDTIMLKNLSCRSELVEKKIDGLLNSN